MKHNTSKLPKWAQQHIQDLEERVTRAEATIPWTKPGMEWFTLFHPDTSTPRESFMLFTCSKAGTRPLCTIGPQDTVFIGRGKRAKVDTEAK